MGGKGTVDDNKHDNIYSFLCSILPNDALAKHNADGRWSRETPPHKYVEGSRETPCMPHTQGNI